MFGLTVTKRFPYRGDSTEEFSNTYWLTGATPASSAGWRTAFDALVALEKACYPSTTTVVRGTAYPDPSVGDEAVWSVDLTQAPNTPVAGTLALGTSIVLPGDSAVRCSWTTSRRVRGKPIYLTKYFHPATRDPSIVDQIGTPQATALNALAAALKDGTVAVLGTITARGHNDTIIAGGYELWVTTRTLKRRGKRNPT